MTGRTGVGTIEMHDAYDLSKSYTVGKGPGDGKSSISGGKNISRMLLARGATTARVGLSNANSGKEKTFRPDEAFANI